jgi:tryptophan-rich sensory protein
MHGNCENATPCQPKQSFGMMIASWYPFIIVIIMVVLAVYFSRQGLKTKDSSVIKKDGTGGYKIEEDDENRVITDVYYGRSKYQPAPAVFSVAWTVIYIAYAITWYKYVPNIFVDSSRNSIFLNFLFLFGMILNVAWTYFYFGVSDKGDSLASTEEDLPEGTTFPDKILTFLSNIEFKWWASLISIFALLLLTIYQAYVLVSKRSVLKPGKSGSFWAASGMFIYIGWLLIATTLNLTTEPKKVYSVTDTA